MTTRAECRSRGWADPSARDANIRSLTSGEHKRCARCGVVKSVVDFGWKRKAEGRRSSYCRPCHAHYNRAHYLANRQLYIERARQSKREIRLTRTKLLLAHFLAHPCSDCGETDPVVLEFDHLRDKSFDISEMFAQHPWELVVREMAKCEVVCANCHRRRTARRAGSVRLILSEATARQHDAKGSSEAG